jgi:hypothetical protein
MNSDGGVPTEQAERDAYARRLEAARAQLEELLSAAERHDTEWVL